MQNQDEPVQDIRKGYFFTPEFDKKSEWAMELSPNEFFGYDDKIGFLNSTPDPYTFFSIENVSRTTTTLKKGTPVSLAAQAS